MLPQILGLLSFVLGRADRWRDKSVEQRTRVAAFLNAVSDCLARIATDLRADRVPHSACSELAHYARQLPEAVERELGEEAADLLAALREAAYSRMAALKRADDLEYARKQMAAIEETVGKVKALAVSLSVG
jgi:hypothetical protein